MLDGFTVIKQLNPLRVITTITNYTCLVYRPCHCQSLLCTCTCQDALLEELHQGMQQNELQGKEAIGSCQGSSGVSPFGFLYCPFTPFCLCSYLLIKHP